MVDAKRKIELAVSCFCKLLQERYTEKLMKEYASVYGIPERGQMPKFDEQKLQKFEDNLPLFENELTYLVATKLKNNGKVSIDTSLHDMELEGLSFNSFDKDIESIIGNYGIVLEIDDKMARVDLVLSRGTIVEKHNALCVGNNQNEFSY